MSLSDFLTLFSARTQSWFWTQRPGKLLMFGASFALTISTILACVWPSGKLDDLEVKGLARGNYGLWAIWVWIYCIVWWFIQDAAKVSATPPAHLACTDSIICSCGGVWSQLLLVGAFLHVAFDSLIRKSYVCACQG